MSASRVCTVCEREKPLTPDYYYRDAHHSEGFKSQCIVCYRKKDKERRANLSPEEREGIRRYNRMRAQQRRSTPEGREKMNEASRKARRKRKKNGAKVKRRREAHRIQYRLQQERQGRDPAEMKRQVSQLANSLEDAAGRFPALPARPLALAIEASDARRRQEFFAGFTFGMEAFTGFDYTTEGDAVGVGGGDRSSHRMVYAWKLGERVDVQFDVADRALTRGRWLWWEVWNEETVRLPALTVHVRRRRARMRGNQETQPVRAEETLQGWRLRYSMYATAERHPYGDLGPDLETLARVEHTFTCIGIEEGCETCAARERAAGRGVQLSLAEAA